MEIALDFFLDAFHFAGTALFFFAHEPFLGQKLFGHIFGFGEKAVVVIVVVSSIVAERR